MGIVNINVIPVNSTPVNSTTINIIPLAKKIVPSAPIIHIRDPSSTVFAPGQLKKPIVGTRVGGKQPMLAPVPPVDVSNTPLCDTSIRGKASTGALISLAAVGKQDTFLSGPDKIFDWKTRQHTDFTVYQTSTYVPATPGVANWPFTGQSILVKMYPKQMGDLLTKMYLKCNFDDY